MGTKRPLCLAKIAMEMVGHKTESIYRRYLITDETMLRDGAARLAALREAERRLLILRH